MAAKRNFFLTLAGFVVVALLLWIAQKNLNPYYQRILTLSAIYAIFAVTFNLIFGYTGQFSLGHAGFAAVGAYVTALLTMSPAQKAANFFLTPIVPFLRDVELPFLPALLIGGLVTVVVSLFVGVPALRLRGDYLAIATLGFSEIIRVLLVNLQSLTNGALGLKGIPSNTNLLYAWGMLAFCVIVCKRLVDSSYGRAMKSVRDDEVAAEALGVNLFKHKILAYIVSSFFAGIAGGLLANLISTIDPKVFYYTLAYQIVGITVIGGMGSLTGSIIAASLYTIFLELLRPIESPFNIGSLQVPGIPGMRMVIFSVLLLVVILFYRRGLMGDSEFTWDALFGFLKKPKVRNSQEGKVG